jgi:hypothetical protein
VPRNTYIYTQKELSHRTTLPLTRAMRLYLEEVSGRCKDDGGAYLDRSQVVRALVAALMKLEDQVDWTGIKDEGELVKRLLRAFSRR